MSFFLQFLGKSLTSYYFKRKLRHKSSSENKKCWKAEKILLRKFLLFHSFSEHFLDSFTWYLCSTSKEEKQHKEDFECAINNFPNNFLSKHNSSFAWVILHHFLSYHFPLGSSFTWHSQSDLFTFEKAQLYIIIMWSWLMTHIDHLSHCCFRWRDYWSREAFVKSSEFHRMRK